MVIDKPESSATEAGFHFIEDYKTCKRYFKYSYVDGLEPIQTPTHLMLGTSLHEGMRTWYEMLRDGYTLQQRISEATRVSLGTLKSHFSDYADIDKYAEDYAKLENVFSEYGTAFPDERMKVLAVEELLEAELPSGDIVTGRIDLAYETEQGRRVICDHKSTGWSLANVCKTLKASDQTTMYKLLWDRNYPDKPINTILYNVVRMTKKGEVTFANTALAKTRNDVEEFMLDTADEFNELAQRLANPDARWPKTTKSCFMYNRPCPFLELCQGENFDGLIDIKFRKKEGY